MADSAIWQLSVSLPTDFPPLPILMNQSERNLVLVIQDEVRKRMADQASGHAAAGHGFDHLERVLMSARTINAEVGADALIIELAVLLHDLGDAKFHDGVERSGEFARHILEKHSVDPKVIDHVVHIVDNLSFRKRAEAAPLSIEGQVVQDADRLDALGAVGIVRTIEYGASIGQPFFAPHDPSIKSGIKHFDEKLFRLRSLMNTSAAKRLAQDREIFMREFLRQYYSECGVPEKADFKLGETECDQHRQSAAIEPSTSNCDFPAE